MRAFLGVARLEQRLLRRDILVASLGLAAVASLTIFGPGGRGLLESTLVRAGAFLVLALHWVTRALATDKAWSSLLAGFPVPPRELVWGRLVARAILAGLLAVTYALLISSDPVGVGRHIVLIWVWLLALISTLIALPLGERRGSWGGIGIVYASFVFLCLAKTLPAVVLAQGRDGTEGGWDALWWPVVILMWNGNHGARGMEWMPAQAPKELRPRGSLVPRFQARRRRAMTPAQVRRHVLGGVRENTPIAQLWITFFVLLLLEPWTRIVSESGRQNGVLVLMLGIFVTLSLKATAAGWAALRAYPVSSRSVLLRGVFTPLCALSFLVAMVYLAGALGGGARIQSNDAAMAQRETGMILRPARWTRGPGHGEPMADQRGPADDYKRLPYLFVPAGYTGAASPTLRPAGMPARVGSVWPLRVRPDRRAPWKYHPPILDGGSAAVQLEDEAAYFRTALRYYLEEVHGITASRAELDAALGEPTDVYISPLAVSLPVYCEHAGPGGQELFSEALRIGGGRVRATVAERYRDAEADGGFALLRPRRAIHAYAPALERLEVALASRLRAATRWAGALNCMLAVLALLFFVRFALIRGPSHWVLPLLPVLCFGAWSNSLGTPMQRAVRDAHLTHPWVMVALFLGVAALIVGSVCRQLDRAEPTL